MHYYGLFNVLRNLLLNLQLGTEMEITFNIDGLPVSISKSSSSHFWLILGKLNTHPVLLIIGIFFSSGKLDSLHTFLELFVKNIKQLKLNVIQKIEYPQYCIILSTIKILQR